MTDGGSEVNCTAVSARSGIYPRPRNNCNGIYQCTTNGSWQNGRTANCSAFSVAQSTRSFPAAGQQFPSSSGPRSPKTAPTTAADGERRSSSRRWDENDQRLMAAQEWEKANAPTMCLGTYAPAAASGGGALRPRAPLGQAPHRGVLQCGGADHAADDVPAIGSSIPVHKQLLRPTRYCISP